MENHDQVKAIEVAIGQARAGVCGLEALVDREGTVKVEGLGELQEHMETLAQIAKICAKAMNALLAGYDREEIAQRGEEQLSA